MTGHESRLGQVIDNLIANARSFSPEGGEVRVKLERSGDGMRVLLGPEGDGARLTVEDSGPGIPEYAEGRVFDRLYSLKDKVTGRYNKTAGKDKRAPDVVDANQLKKMQQKGIL